MPAGFSLIPNNRVLDLVHLVCLFVCVFFFFFLFFFFLWGGGGGVGNLAKLHCKTSTF